VKIKYKGEEYLTPYNKIALKIKKDYYSDELLKKFDDSEYKIIFTSKKFLSIMLQTDGKVDLLKQYEKFEKEEYVDSIIRYKPGTAEYQPNDTEYQNNKQYALTKLNMSNVWDHTKGDTGLIIAVLDTGIPIDNNGNLSHPDLKNTNRIKKGLNFSGSPGSIGDIYGHGTSVAGIMGAEANNGIGIAGVCFASELFISKVLDDTGSGSVIGLANGIRNAVDSGCKIINLSLGS
jgi:subtilisin family serine protease